VMLVKPGTLPKTSSGKLQRSLTKTKYLEETLDLV
jgi:acyl-CoA synthetase (AMP-forming)/AMP-acid ligase II